MILQIEPGEAPKIELKDILEEEEENEDQETESKKDQ